MSNLSHWWFLGCGWPGSILLGAPEVSIPALHHLMSCAQLNSRIWNGASLRQDTSDSGIKPKMGSSEHNKEHNKTPSSSGKKLVSLDVTKLQQMAT